MPGKKYLTPGNKEAKPQSYKKKFSFNFYQLSLGGLCLLALALRLYLLEDISLHEDEIASQRLYVQRPVAYIFTDYHPNNHWLASILGHLLGQLGPQRFLVRWPSVLFGTMSIPLLALTAQRLLRRRQAGLIAAGLLCFSAFHWQWSQLFRGYSALLCFTLCSFWLGQQALKTNQPRYWLGLGLALSCAIASHLYGVLWLITLLIILLGQALGQAQSRKWVLALSGVGLILAAFFIWFGKTYVIDLYHASPAGSVSDRIFYQWLALGPTLPKVFSFLTHLAVAVTAQSQYEGLALILFWGLSLPGLLFLYRAKPQVAYTLGLWLLLPLTLVILTEFALAGFFVSERFFLFILPAWLMLVTYSLLTISEWSLTHYPLHWPFRKAMGGVFLLLPLGYLGLLNLNLAHLYLAHQVGYPWRVAAHHLAQTLAPPDLIICHHLPHRWTNSPAHSPDECITEVGQRLAEAVTAPTLPLQRLENVVTLETGLQFRERASQAGVVWVVLWGAALPPLEQKVNSVPDQTEKLSLLVFNRQPSLVANLERAIASLAQMDTLSPDRFTYDLYRAKLLAYQGQPGQAEHLLRTAAAHSLPAVALAETKNTLRTLAHFSKPGLIPTQPLAVNFGRPPLIGLRGYTLTGPAQAGQSLSLTLFWESRAATATDYTIFLHIRDEQQQIVSQLDIQPFAGRYPTSRWIPGTKIEETLVLTLPPDLSPGWYSLYLGLYQVDSLTRLPLTADHTGENALFLERLWLASPAAPTALIRPRSTHSPVGCKRCQAR